ncbi:MAG: threonine dehydratase [Planctomycetaceae bacterium]
MDQVTFDDVLHSVARVREVLQPTPLYEWPGLSDHLGCRLFLKHENHQPVGAFKVRGGVNLVSQLDAQQRSRGLLACSTGNHGQSLAFAARRFSVPCTIVVPQHNNPDKNRAMRQLGATVIEHGHDYDAARDYLEQQLLNEGGRYVHSANEPALIAGVGTMAVEVLDQLPDPDVILVPVGLGSGVCGTGLVMKARSPRTQVVGVQARGASAVIQTWKSGRAVKTEVADTWAEGMATRSSAELTMRLMRRDMDDAILVDDDELRRGCGLLLRETHNLAEGAGAATVAAAMQQRERFRGQRVVAILSGGNLDLNELPAILKAI